MTRIKALAPSGGPIHKMQPISGSIPPIEFHLQEDGQVELCMFCRSGPSRGMWHHRVGPADQMLDFLNNLHATAEKGTPWQVLCEMELFFQWEWDRYGGTTLREPTPAGPLANITLEDLGL